MLADDVTGEELLYRSVRIAEMEIANRAVWRVQAQAFADRGKRISVDRASLVGFQPDRSRLTPEQAIIFLKADDARAQGPVDYNPPRPADHAGDWLSRSYGVGVSSDPLPDNPAHALIHLIPFEEDASTPFDKLKHRLARLVNDRLLKGEPVVVLP